MEEKHNIQLFLISAKQKAFWKKVANVFSIIELLFGF